MSDPASQFYSSAQSYDSLYLTKPDDPYTFDTADLGSKQSFDFFQFAEVDPYHLEAFDSDIDNLASADPTFDAQVHNLPLTVVDQGDIYSFLRSDTPIRGAPSTITVSSASESAYDSGYSDSLSSYNPYVTSPSSQYSSHPLVQELDKDMDRLGIRGDNGSTYSSVMPSSNSEHSSPGSISLASFSPNTYHRSSFSDYEPVMHGRVPSSSASDYYPQASRYTQSVVQATVSPANVSAQLPIANQSPSPLSHMGSIKSEDSQTDPKRKYPCPTCHRSFARQFNLKTHVQTHDPNRAKPFACSHKGCGRAFSRKHDLMRHLTSIHRPGMPSSAQAIGVGNTGRSRCDQCGKSWIGKDKDGCECDDEK